jgi:hypothetical protein
MTSACSRPPSPRPATIPRVSRRDLAHVLNAMSERSSGRAGDAVAVADIDEAIGRHGGDMRTPLNLESLRADGLVAPAGDDAWALTPEGVAWLRRDRELSGG